MTKRKSSLTEVQSGTGVELGDKVSYVRLDANGAELHGTGIVFAKYLNEDYRTSVRVRDLQTGQPVNTDLVAVNTTEDGARKYFDHQRAILAIAEEGGAENKKLVARFNGQIEELEIAYKGDRVKVGS